MYKVVICILIELGFLMMGHTHESIDALFGNLGKWLRKHNALTIPGISLCVVVISSSFSFATRLQGM